MTFDKLEVGHTPEFYGAHVIQWHLLATIVVS